MKIHFTGHVKAWDGLLHEGYTTTLWAGMGVIDDWGASAENAVKAIRKGFSHTRLMSAQIVQPERIPKTEQKCSLDTKTVFWNWVLYQLSAHFLHSLIANDLVLWNSNTAVAIQQQIKCLWLRPPCDGPVIINIPAISGWHGFMTRSTSPKIGFGLREMGWWEFRPVLGLSCLCGSGFEVFLHVVHVGRILKIICPS